jgi:hypothetical protein
MKHFLLIAALVASHAQALELPPGSEQTLTGTVSELQADHTFYVQTADARVLVYANAALVKALRVGATVQVQGKVPTDWLKLAAHELQASKVRVL